MATLASCFWCFTGGHTEEEDESSDIATKAHVRIINGKRWARVVRFKTGEMCEYADHPAFRNALGGLKRQYDQGELYYPIE